MVGEERERGAGRKEKRRTHARTHAGKKKETTREKGEQSPVGLTRNKQRKTRNENA